MVNLLISFLDHNKMPSYTWEKDLEQQKKCEDVHKSKL